jgi:hypothetical protein
MAYSYRKTYDEVHPSEPDVYPEIENGFVGAGGFDYCVDDRDDPEWQRKYDEARADATVTYNHEEDGDEGETESAGAVAWLAKALRDGGFGEPSSSPGFVAGDWFSWSDGEMDMHTGITRRESLHPDGFTTEEIQEAYAIAFKK